MVIAVGDWPEPRGKHHKKETTMIKLTTLGKLGSMHHGVSVAGTRRLWSSCLLLVGALTILAPGAHVRAAHKEPFVKPSRSPHPPTAPVGDHSAGLALTTAAGIGDTPELAGGILQGALATGNKNSRSHFYATQRNAQTAFDESTARIR